MNKHVAKPSSLKKIMRSSLASIVIALLALSGLTAMESGAQAAVVLDVSASTFNFDYPTNGTLMSGASNSTSGSVVKYTNVTGTPVNGISIDAIVTMTLTNSAILSGASGSYDNPGKASTNANYFQVDTSVSAAYGYAQFKYDFYESGTYTGPNTGSPVILKNLSVTTIDIDGSNTYCQYTDFTGFQSYYLGAGSALIVKTNATDATIPVGTTRFFAGSCANNANRVEDAAQIKFDAVSTFTAKFGTDRTSNPNYFGIAFKPLSAVFGVTQPAPVNNPTNQPPTSTDTTRYYVNGQASVVQLGDFGNYSDPDGNPFIKVQITALPTTGTLEKLVNGSWVAVALNDEILVSDITNGNLRFTGTVNTTLQFKVSDGNAYSTSANTMTLLVSNQSQTITFNNPGAKTPTTPAFASGATASSGLSVTLTSLTPGVCSVSGTNITPLASGICTIVASQSGNSTYGAAAPVTQTFPISTLTPQTITAPNPGNQNWTGSTSTITVSPTALSGLTVSLISLSPAVCTVSGFVITILGPGNCTIRNVQAGNGTYSSAPPVEYTFSITGAPASYTLTYAANNATTGSVPTAQTGSGNLTLATNLGVLTRTGYTFAGWNTAANGTGTHYNVGATYNLTANVTLYAEWTAVTYTITYVGNGNTGGSVPSNFVGFGSTNLASNSGSLVKTGATFTGWNTAANGTGTHYATGAAYSLTADVTLYAEWTTNTYTITYNGNSNSSGAGPSNHTGAGSVSLASSAATLVRTGYSFGGWNTQADGLGTHYATGASYNLVADVTLYAEWTLITYTITYAGNGNTGGTDPNNQTGVGSVNLESNSGNLVKTGYTFTGWNTAANGTGTHYATGASYNLTGNISLYAQWTLITYTITYDGNSNSSGTAPADQIGAGSVHLANTDGTLVRTGYSFAGWNTQADGQGTDYALNAPYNLTADVTLFAKWARITYTLTYSGNGNTAGTAPGNQIDTGNVTLENNTGSLSKPGFSFTGWNTHANGTGTHYAEAGSYNLIGNTTLYAEWTPLSFTIIYDGNTSTGGVAPANQTGYGPKRLAASPGTLVKTGYVFKGWNTLANGTGTHYIVNASYDLLADITLYAEWEVMPAIVYAPNGATGGTTPIDIPAGSPIRIDPNTGNLIRAGYHFLGWNTEPNGSGQHFGAGMTPVLPAGTTLYAEWAPITSHLASTGGTVAPVLPLGGALVILGALFTRRRRVRKN
jgi:uncharacterized repeat protein (TIGR02543 family)/LPXTG-motif cell wall-anchored protein